MYEGEVEHLILSSNVIVQYYYLCSFMVNGKEEKKSEIDRAKKNENLMFVELGFSSFSPFPPDFI